MLKHLSIFAAAATFAASPVSAQTREAVLQYIDVPDAGYDLVLAAPKPGTHALPDLGNAPDALIVHLPGGELALVFEDAGKMIEAIDLLRSPVFAARVPSKGAASSQPVALYVVPKDSQTAIGSEMTKVRATQR
jgi:hypothetical protein